MAKAKLPLILESEQLLPLLGAQELLIVDLSDQATHRAYHVPGAIHLDYETLTCELPASPGAIALDAPLSRTLNQIGLNPKRHLIAYDNGDNAKACRLLWTLDLVGQQNYSLLNGGLAAWLDERHPTESHIDTAQAGQYKFSYRQHAPAADLFYILTHLGDKKVTLLDARSANEYSGREVRGKRGGHIPGAIHLDYRRLIAPEHSMRLKNESELRAIVKELGLKRKQEIISYCHTHRRSALVYIALKSLGFEQLKAYPGSFAEWGDNLDTPIE